MNSARHGVRRQCVHVMRYPLLLLPGLAPCGAVVAGEPASLCQQLATQVRQSAPADAEKVLRNGIATAGPVSPGRWGSREIAMDTRLRKVLETEGVLSADGPASVMELDHLPGTLLYMGSVVAGTAECQTVAFATLKGSGEAGVLPRPAGYRGTCWNMQGSLATVLGHPAYVESGTVSSTTADAVARVTPWTGEAWGAPCQLTVEFNYTVTLARQFCSETSPCHGAAAVATDIARGYVAYSAMRQPPVRVIDAETVPDFLWAGVAGGPQAQAAVNAGWQALKRRQQAEYPGTPASVDTIASVFPALGHPAPNAVGDYGFSYVNFVLFPLLLDGRLYLGAVGHNGVGWREGSDILVAIYAVPGADTDDLVPLAGFVLERRPTGLKGTVVAEGGSAVPGNP